MSSDRYPIECHKAKNEITISKKYTDDTSNARVHFKRKDISEENYLFPPESFPVGTFIIPMDNTLQSSNGVFRMETYGLLIRLLHADIPLKWAIKSNKSKDAIDFTVQVKPRGASNSQANLLSFVGGAFIVTPSYEAEASSIINSYGNNITVYELTASASIEIYSDITHKPKAALLDNGGNADIHEDVYEEAGLIQGVHYDYVNSASELNNSSCFTFASEPHTDPGEINSSVVNQVKEFLQSGGNFLAQCEGVKAYAEASNGSLLATFDEDPGIGGSIVYTNADEPYAQFVGNLDDEDGSVKSFIFSSNPAGGKRIAYDDENGNNYKAYVGRQSGMTTAQGGYIHYLGGHKYDGNSLGQINGQRLLMNAMMRPSDRPTSCGLVVSNDDDNPPSDCSDEILVYGGNCIDSPDDAFAPQSSASCINQPTYLAPYNGTSTSSCSGDIICIESSVNGWEFSFSATNSTTFTGITPRFLYPIDINTAGGPSNSSSCSNNFNYTVKFFVNNSLVETKTGNIPADVFTNVPINLTNAININQNDVIRVRIDGNPSSTSCQLFELQRLAVRGCCGISEDCPTPVINAPEGEICQNETYTFSSPDLGFDCLEYQWNFGANANPSTATGLGPITVIFSNSGTYQVSLTTTNNCNPVNPPVVFGCCNQDERGEHDHPHKLILEYVGSGSPNVIFRGTEVGNFTFFSGQVSNGDVFVIDGTGHTDKHGELNRLDTDTEFSINGGSFKDIHTSCSQDLSPGFGVQSDGDLVQNGTSSNSLFIVRGIVMLETGSGSDIYCEEGVTNGGSGGSGSGANGTTVCGTSCFECEETVTINLQVEDCDPCIDTDLMVNLGADTTICNGTDARLNAKISGGFPPYTLTWSDNTISTFDCTPDVNPSSTTTYGVTVTDFNGCTNSDSQVVNVFNCPDCEISAIVLQPVYNDNGTPNNLTDDTFTFAITINGSSSFGWTGGGLSGSYGQTVTFGPYPVDSTGAIFEVRDAVDLNCSVSIGMNMSSCVYLETCTCCEPD